LTLDFEAGLDDAVRFGPFLGAVLTAVGMVLNSWLLRLDWWLMR
jgi:hypothetical protein